jgi:hypothetical protein
MEFKEIFEKVFFYTEYSTTVIKSSLKPSKRKFAIKFSGGSVENWLSLGKHPAGARISVHSVRNHVHGKILS